MPHRTKDTMEFRLEIIIAVLAVILLFMMMSGGLI
jgi:hypothetical protein